MNDAPAAIEPGHGDPLIGPLDRRWTQGTALLAALFFSSLAHAQLPSNSAGASLTGVERQILLESPPQGFEEPVDPSAYRVVPGDIYAMGLWGAVDTLVTVVVGPEGSLVIPSVGIVPVDGLTLAAAQTRVAEEVRRVFPRAEVTLSLIRLGTFRVEGRCQALEIVERGRARTLGHRPRAARASLIASASHTSCWRFASLNVRKG